MRAERMMKWRVRRQSKCYTNSEVNEDVRRSLEILDNVLAEFDDHDVFSPPSDILVNGDEQGSPLSHAHQEKERWEDENGNKVEQSNLSSYNGDVSSEVQSLGSSIDGTTSQHSSLLDESRRCSAPPVPKRSPGTRLSNRDRHFLHKEEEYDDETSEIRGSYHSLGSLQLTSQNGDDSHKATAEGKRKAALSVQAPGTSSSSRTVDDNAQISNRSSRREITNPCLEFYLVRNGDDEDDDVFISPPRREVNCKSASCRICGANLDQNALTPSPTESLDTRKVVMDATKPSLQSETQLRRMRLEKKFAKVKFLLQTNQVIGLDKPPPSFKPPPPPISHKTTEKQVELTPVAGTSSATWGSSKTRHDFEHLTKQRPRVGSLSETQTPNGSARTQISVAKSGTRRVSLDQRRIDAKTSDRSVSKECVKCEAKDVDNVSNHHDGEVNHSSAIKDCVSYAENKDILPNDVLCQNCIDKGWTFRSSEFVPHSPSSLKRPPLGLSYSMEDDLSPGIKEILSPPPKMADGQSDSVLSSPKSSPATHMSTFSHSASSLGDGSSQSDLDFSTSVDSGKVPLISIKSLTLPTDMKLGPSPFYSDMEGENVNGTDSKLGVRGLEAMRSSSAPPPPQDKGHWKKDKTGFNRNTQNKNDSVDSSHHGEEEATTTTTEEKPKKRSVWKSILRRK